MVINTSGNLKTVPIAGRAPIIIWRIGDKYVGEFVDDKATGYGTYFFLADNENKGDKYIGQFKDWVFDGEGTYYYSNGSVEKGFYREGDFQYAIDNTPVVTPTPTPTYDIATVRDVQTMLRELGYDPGPADGKMGNRTTNAIIAYQSTQNGFAGRNGDIEESLLSSLSASVQNKLVAQQQVANLQTTQTVQLSSLSQQNNVPLGKRVALVIGNGDYGSIGMLPNPPNDAVLMAKTLRGLGFEVIEKIDADQKSMKRAVRDFGKLLSSGRGEETVGLFYYAGHGVQVKGANYIIPVDAQIESEGDVDIEAIDANAVLSMMEHSGASLNFVILDACRNNPFVRSFRSGTRGLAEMDAPTGSFIAYATSPGDVAADGEGRNSPYTKALTKAMLEPGVEVELMFKKVRNSVRVATNKEQTPWESSSLIGGNFYFNPAKGEKNLATLTPTTTTVIPTIQQPAQSFEIIFWQSIQASTDADDYQAYLEQYPNGTFAGLAKVKVRKYTVSAIVPSAVVPEVINQQASLTTQGIDGPISKLRGFNIWVRTNMTSDGQKYCRLLTNAGLNVECDPDYEDSNNDTFTDIYLKCPRLPADAGKLIKDYLGVPHFEVYDWRFDAEYGDDYCNEYDAMSMAFFN